MRRLGTWLLLFILCASVARAQVTAQRAADFLNLLSTQAGISGGGSPYGSNGAQLLADFNYLGITHARDGLNINLTPGTNPYIEFSSLVNGGVTFDAEVPYPSSGTQTPATFVSQAHAFQAVNANAIFALEGINEPGLFYPTADYGSSGYASSSACTGSGGYGGGGCTWLPVAQYTRDWVPAILADSALKNLPIFAPSKPGQESDNVGMQFLTIPTPTPSGVIMPAGTNFGQYLNNHIYPQDQQFLHSPGILPACQPNDSNAGNAFAIEQTWDNVTTYNGNYSGYSSLAAAQAFPRVATEFGYHTSNGGTTNINEDKKGRCIVNGTLVAWQYGETVLSIYALLDTSGDGFGLMSSPGTPLLSGTYLHNFTTILKDTGPNARTFTVGSLSYTLSGMPSTAQTQLFQKSNGHFELVIWDDASNWNFTTSQPITVGPTSVTVSFGPAYGLTAYDTVTGTSPTQTIASGRSITVPVADEPAIIDIAPLTLGNFSITSAGQILSPNGLAFQARGVTIDSNDAVASAVLNSLGQPLTTLFPGVNFVILASGLNGASCSNPYDWSLDLPATLGTVVNRLTALGIVTVIENYAFPQTCSVQTGSNLTSEVGWYTSWATWVNSSATNPALVWFATPNEPVAAGGTGVSQAPVTAEEVAIYNGIRGVPNNNIILLSTIAGGTPGSIGKNCTSGFCLTPISAYATMTNVVWVQHQYSWVVGGQSSVVPVSTIYNYILSEVAADQTIPTGDSNTPPVGIFEYGPSTTGTSQDASGQNNYIAVQETSFSTSAWNWDSGDCCNNLTNDTNALTSPYGTTTAAYIAAGQGPLVPKPSISSPISVATAVNASVAVNPITATDTAYPNDTQTFTGTSTGSGKLTATGATGNGTSTITFTGSLNALNTLLNTVSFIDAVSENPTLTFTVEDAHSLSGTDTTAVTVTPPVSSNCTIITTVGPQIISVGPPSATWSLTGVPGQVVVDGTVDSTTANVTELAYVSGVVWQLNTAGNWYSKTIPSQAWSAPTTTSPTASCTVGSLTITSPSAVSAVTNTATAISPVSASDTANPADTMTFSATATGSGKMTATGAAGSGTASISFTGTLNALNTLLGTLSFTDSAVETSTLAFTVSDQHSLTAHSSTPVTVAAPAGHPVVTAPASLSAVTGAVTAVSSVSATDSTYPNDTMSFTGTSTGSGTLTATGATGNGTGSISFTGSLTALNTLLGTMTFMDAVVEDPTLTFTVEDAHSATGSATTAVTVTGAISPNCTIVRTVGPAITSAGPPSATWALNGSNQVVVNGSVDGTISNVNELAYVSSLVWAGLTNGTWEYKSIPANSWSSPTSTNPTTSCGTGVTVTAPSSITAIYNTTTPISGVAAADPGNPNDQMTLTATASSGAKLYAGGQPSGQGTSTLMFTGLLSGLNSLLSTMAIVVPGPTIIYANTGETFVDGSGYIWSIGTGSGGQSLRNGVLPNGQFTANVTEMALVSGVVWSVNATQMWYMWSGSAWVAGTNPIGSPAAATIENGSPGSFMDTSGNTWTIVSGVAYENGSSPAFSANVQFLYLVGTMVWLENTSSQFYYFTAASGGNPASWTAGPNPIGAAVSVTVSFSVTDQHNNTGSANTSVMVTGSAASPNFTITRSVGVPITDALGEQFSITSGGQISVNGATDTTTANVVQLVWANALIWQLNTSGNWYYKANAAATWLGPTKVGPINRPSGLHSK